MLFIEVLAIQRCPNKKLVKPSHMTVMCIVVTAPYGLFFWMYIYKYVSLDSITQQPSTG